MSDWLRIQQRLSSLLAESKPFVLVTVVGVQGPSYRPPGARMLVFATGESEGMISGGCLERDVIQHALALKPGDPAVLLCYRTAEGEDLLMGTGTGCGGTIQLLLEAFDGAQDSVFLNLQRAPKQAFAAEALLFGVSDGVSDAHEPRQGTRLWLDEKGVASFVPALQGELAQALLADLRQLQEQARKGQWTGKGGLIKNYSFEGQQCQALLEVFKPIPTLLLCGAGDDALPLLKMAKELGWQLAIADHRDEKRAPERLPDGVLALDPREPLFAQASQPFRKVVIMSHNLHWDQHYLNLMLERELQYLGVLGPWSRTARILRAIGKEPTAQLRAPVGLELGAKTAAEIALSILAELLQTENQASGGPKSQPTS